MPIEDFEGETFVAFLDISGFKDLMKNEEKAINALDKFYKYGYNVISEHLLINSLKSAALEGIFISDCGILFVSTNHTNRSNREKNISFRSILRAVKRINKNMLNHDVMLKTSIAYGKFKYSKKIEFIGISKNQFFGNAYISAYIDMEKTLPKIQPGECRIVKKNFPLKKELTEPTNNEIFHLIKEKYNDKAHYYFYWMIENFSQILEFERMYSELYNLKYKGMLDVLKRFSNK